MLHGETLCVRTFKLGGVSKIFSCKLHHLPYFLSSNYVVLISVIMFVIIFRMQFCAFI